MIMGGERWHWKESIKNGPTNDYYEYEILIRLADQEKYVYSIKGFINNE